jgi:hypothetical protein
MTTWLCQGAHYRKTALHTLILDSTPARLRPEACPHPVIAALVSAEDPPPEPADEPPCPSCGHAHVLVIEEVVVSAPAEAAP